MMNNYYVLDNKHNVVANKVTDHIRSFETNIPAGMYKVGYSGFGHYYFDGKYWHDSTSKEYRFIEVPTNCSGIL